MHITTPSTVVFLSLMGGIQNLCHLVLVFINGLLFYSGISKSYFVLYLGPLLAPYTLLTAEIIKWQKCARMGLNGFHIKCIIGTHCN